MQKAFGQQQFNFTEKDKMEEIREGREKIKKDFS
jgi:hypothetical protein